MSSCLKHVKTAAERYFVFEGRNLQINNSLAIFITMNPMYEFRNVLPSNLKVGRELHHDMHVEQQFHVWYSECLLYCTFVHAMY